MLFSQGNHLNQKAYLDGLKAFYKRTLTTHASSNYPVPLYDGEPYLPRKSGGKRRHLLTLAYVKSFELIGDLPEILPLARGVPTTPEVVTPDLAEELKSFATLKHWAQQLLAETGR